MKFEPLKRRLDVTQQSSIVPKCSTHNRSLDTGYVYDSQDNYR